MLGSLRLGELGAQGSAMGDPAGSAGVLPQGSEEERVGGKSQGWLRDRACPEGTGDQGSAEGPQEEPLGSVFGLRPVEEREVALTLSQHSHILCPGPFSFAQPRLDGGTHFTSGTLTWEPVVLSSPCLTNKPRNLDPPKPGSIGLVRAWLVSEGN